MTVQDNTRVERYERVRTEFSKKNGGWSLLSIMVSTSAVCGITASLQVCKTKFFLKKRETKGTTQLRLILGREGISNRVKQRKDLLSETQKMRFFAISVWRS